MKTGKEIAHLRKDYQRDSLDPQQLKDNPIQQFDDWFKAALDSDVVEPNAVALATCVAGKPSLRIVLLKGYDEDGFVFYTNYKSRKGQELAENPHAALTFWWDRLERQVRIEGRVERVDPETSEAYYQSRDRGSRLGAWASPQSQAIEDRESLSKRVEAVTQRFEGQEAFPRPPFWGGYRVIPDHIEFWQGRSNRLHDRIVYQKGEQGWEQIRLAP